MPPGAPLPGELALARLAGRFAEAEHRIRELLRQAPTGDRRRLLAWALATLLELRQVVAELAAAAALTAYATAALAAQLLTGRPAPAPERATDLGRGLQLGLDRALVSVEERSRAAFRTVTTVTLAEAERDALTARTDRLGRPYPLAAEAAMRTQTVAAHASTRGTVDTLGEGAEVAISNQAAPECHFNGICRAFAGRTLTIGDRRARFAPYHPGCSHRTLPAGSSLADVAAAQLLAAQRMEAVRAQREAVATIS